MQRFFYGLGLVALWAGAGQVHAQPGSQTSASVPFTPSWAARHYLQWLGDHAGLPLTGSH